MAQCTKIKDDGKRCEAAAITDAEFCFIHEPSKAAERAVARKKGGYNRQTKHGGQVDMLPENFRTMEDVLCLLDYTVLEALAMENGVQRNRLLIALAGEYRTAISQTEFEMRIKALEDSVYGIHTYGEIESIRSTAGAER